MAKHVSVICHCLSLNVVVLYELYELYNGGKFLNVIELYNVIEFYIFQNEDLILAYKPTISPW